MGDDDQSRDLDWEKRVLCSDEGCIGVIGPDGRCKECGRLFEGVLSADHSQSADDVQSESGPVADVQEPAENGDDAPSNAQPADTDEEWNQRTLCRDEDCIGVIGPDGRCKECGLPYEGNK